MKPYGKRIAVIMGLAVVGVGIAAYAGALRPDSARGADTSGSTGITVSGTGTVKATPDQASFSFGVESQAETADAAISKNNEVVQKVIDAIKGAGIAAADIQTQQVSVYPRYSDNGQNIVGYSASNSVNVTIRDLAKISAVVQAATAAGANQVYGPNLTVSEQSGLYQQALSKALDDAREKAQALAKFANVGLGRITNIVEGSPVVPVPYATDASAAGAKGVPVEPGQQDIQATIVVTFSIT
jgi:uncharacterized protein YggE